MDTDTLVMLTLDERRAVPVTVTAKNNGSQPIRARVLACGFDRDTLKDHEKPTGEFLALKWGQMGARFLVLPPGAQKTSQPFKVAGDKTHVVIYGAGDGLMDCHCEVSAAPGFVPTTVKG